MPIDGRSSKIFVCAIRFVFEYVSAQSYQQAEGTIQSKVVMKGKDRNEFNNSNSKECVQLKMLRIANDVPAKADGTEVEEIPARWKERRQHATGGPSNLYHLRSLPSDNFARR